MCLCGGCQYFVRIVSLPFCVLVQATSPEVGYWLQWIVSLLRRHGSYLQSAKGRLAVLESLRALLRVCVQHEKDLLRISQDNLFLSSFLCDQMQPSRDVLSDLEAQRQAEQELLDRQAQQEQEEEEGSYVLAMEGSESGEDVPWTISLDGSGGAWNSAWNDDDDEEVVEEEMDEEEEKPSRPQDNSNKTKKNDKKTKSTSGQSGPASKATSPKEEDSVHSEAAALKKKKKKAT